MKIFVLSASPNKNGLTAACASAALKGIQAAGGETETVCLNDLKIDKCHACDNGWGTCLEEHRCKEEDDFQGLHARMKQGEGFILVTPVYYAEMSESAKAFTDRLRRCEATQEEGNSFLYNKPVIMVAAAGGGGGGMLTTLQSLERWIQHVHARYFDLIPVNRWTRRYKLATIHAASKAMVRELFLQEAGG